MHREQDFKVSDIFQDGFQHGLLGLEKTLFGPIPGLFVDASVVQRLDRGS